ncbi:hypothetical protein ACHQM5_019169 [Ranunculus cassubicifolius]
MANTNQNLLKKVKVLKWGIEREGSRYEYQHQEYGKLTLGATKEAFEEDLANFLEEHGLDSENFEVAFINALELINGIIFSRVYMEKYPIWEEFKLLVTNIRVYELAPSSIPPEKFKRPYVQDYEPPSSTAKFKN